MNSETSLVPTASETVARAQEAPVALSLQQAFHAVVTGDLDAAKLAVMKDLLAMSAEQQFNAAFVRLQADLPVIVARTIIPNRGKYEKFEDVMEVVGRLLTKHGFTVSFSQGFTDNRIVETCVLSHAGGHSRANSFAVRTGGRSDSDTQADCKAATTAKRNALCNALNIVIRQDALNSEDDARIEGDPDEFVTAQEAFELERRVNETNSNKQAFLDYAKAPSFDKIPANKYEELDGLLAKRERRGK